MLHISEIDWKRLETVEEAGIKAVSYTHLDVYKRQVQDLEASCVTDERVLKSYTPAMGGWHRAYVGEVVEAYQKR